ncbi:hypothetical protein Q4603_05645 [Zobellia galactanivorans]|uniref:hypothetical protein n=1 Tax=Zobellia galactanivorans (strain DSM 12802 / CCUG 47099 / CIP 106680 / NCIMB 13871 / Dsij) TaxID=63186 RepID=UPI0026E31D1E|nr:hypothetical protein [Zobellia galactanivorans]MDO6808078.1 hypothetical protein [Zobellia galactanivorans]
MRLFSILFFCLTAVFSQDTTVVLSQKLAFPGAMGLGKNTIGGRGGLVLHVTNLNDSGTGSLRDAVESYTQPRVIVFDVGGYIDLTTPIKVRKDYGFVSILGGTAPDPGIHLRGAGFMIHDEEVILQGITIRPGRNGYNPDVANRGTANYEPPDALSIVAFANQTINNVIVDHCSIGFGHDGLIDLGASSSSSLSNVSITNTIQHENIDKGYGNLFDSNGTVSNVTFARNILHGNKERNIFSDMYGGGKLEIINNLFTFTREACGLFYGTKTDIIGNTWNQLTGSGTRISGTIRVISGSSGVLANTEIYSYDNLDGGVSATYNTEASNSLVASRLADSGLTIISSSELQNALSDIGPKYDPQKNRIIQAAFNHTGSLIQHENEVGGFPTISSSSRPAVFYQGSTHIAADFYAQHNLSGDGTNVTTNWDFGTYQVVNNAGYTDREMYWAWLARDLDKLAGMASTDGGSINKGKSSIFGMIN